MQINHNPSAGNVAYVARYVDASNYQQKTNSGTPLTDQDVYAPIEAQLSETGQLLSLRVNAGPNGRFFDAGVDGIHHSMEPGYANRAAADTLVIPPGNGRPGLEFISDKLEDFEALAEAQREANRFMRETLAAIQGGHIVPAKSWDFK